MNIEMMMHGLPIVTSDGYSVKNMFHDGVNAKVACIENWRSQSKFVKNLTESILYVLNSEIEAKKIQVGAREMYQSKYSIECMKKGYSDLFNSL